MNAASSGPIADPVLPPTWNSDWAKPCRPPEAMRATRDDFGMEHRRTDADQRRGQQDRRIVAGDRQQQQSDQAAAHRDRQRVRLRATVGDHANHRLQHRGGELGGERDQPDLAEIEPVGFLQNWIERRNQRLVHVVQQMADRERHQDREGRGFAARRGRGGGSRGDGVVAQGRSCCVMVLAHYAGVAASDLCVQAQFWSACGKILPHSPISEIIRTFRVRRENCHG